MCTGFERSAYSVINHFSKSEPKTISDLKSTLGEDIFFLFLGGGQSLTQFVRASKFEGFLKRSEDNAYLLTDKGEMKLNELKAKQPQVA